MNEKTLNKKVIEDIDVIIDCWNLCPDAFDQNVWKCYSDCKKVIYKAQEDGLISAPYTNTQEYDNYIGYITNKLGI